MEEIPQISLFIIKSCDTKKKYVSKKIDVRLSGSRKNKNLSQAFWNSQIERFAELDSF